MMVAESEVWDLMEQLGPDACQTARLVFLEMVRAGVIHFREMHNVCDANDLLLRVGARCGLEFEDLADDDYRLANGVVTLADWLGTGLFLP